MQGYTLVAGIQGQGGTWHCDIIVLLTQNCRANSADDAVRRGQRQVEQSKIKLGIQMDDKMFQAYVLETQVKVV